MENPLYFFHHWKAALFCDEIDLKNSITWPYNMNDLIFIVRKVLYIFPLLLPYGIILFALIKSNTKKHAVAISILLFPLFLFIIDFVLKGFIRQTGQHLFMLFIATSLYVFIKVDQLRDYPISARLFKFAVFVSLCYSFLFPLYMGSSEEILFTRAYYGYDKFQNLEDEKKLLENISTNGKILLDDNLNYSLVYLTNDPQRFILPYEHEFETAAAKPNLFVKYIVFSDDIYKDQVRNRLVGDQYDLVDNYELVGRFGKYELYHLSQRTR